jgi:hypothetical protein
MDIQGFLGLAKERGDLVVGRFGESLGVEDSQFEPGAPRHHRKFRGDRANAQTFGMQVFEEFATPQVLVAVSVRRYAQFGGRRKDPLGDQISDLPGFEFEAFTEFFQGHG